MAGAPVKPVGSRMLQLVLAATLACAAVSVHGAKVYKWVDDEGNVHFGDRPTETGDAEEVTIRQSAPPAPAAPQRQDHSNISAIMEEDRLQRKAAKEKEKEERAERQRRCHIARDNLRGITSAGVVYDIDQSGTRVVLNREQRMFAEARARQQVAAWCDD